eukprot:TRINITY_DN1548_c0_g1_i1.p1 TRINITY_DN1548_c0_g1~~TRINITY_DN1548_c0_g1_i1.p1  ORF type:complete len:156 (-),score=39.06 TRINITY_DN1548_c0_g1_i1:156-623(-)
MARGSSSRGSRPSAPAGRTIRKPSPVAAKPAPKSNVPAPAPAAQPPAQQMSANSNSGGGGSFMGAMASTVAQGFAFGTGSSIAHRAVDSVMGPRHSGAETDSVVDQAMPAAVAPKQMSNCQMDLSNFQQCLSQNNNDIASCQFYFDMLNQCQKGA